MAAAAESQGDGGHVQVPEHPPGQVSLYAVRRRSTAQLSTAARHGTQVETWRGDLT